MNREKKQDQLGTRTKLKVMAGLVVATFVCLAIMFASNPSLGTNASPVATMIDYGTADTLYEVEPTKDMYTIEWLSDSMDKGNHNLNTNVHGKLVISPYVETYMRGMIVHYMHGDEEHIGRLVGLPGEKIEIRDGQVYIDDLLLEAFYGLATSYGLTKDVYFDALDPENRNGNVMEDYFNQSMDPVTIEEDTFFILVDNWWRGKDSKDFGPIKKEAIKGQVIGYEKK